MKLGVYKVDASHYTLIDEAKLVKGWITGPEADGTAWWKLYWLKGKALMLAPKLETALAMAEGLA